MVEDPVPDPTITSIAESLRTYLKNLFREQQQKSH